MTLRAGRGPGSPPGNGGTPKLHPHRPPPEGAAGNGMLPVFLQHLPPQSGRAGNETMAFFFQDFRQKTRPLPNLARSD